MCADVSITTDEDTLGSTAPDCSDVDVEPLTYTVGAAGEGVSGTSAGDLSYDPDGQFESLDTGESDSDSFTYQASDGTTSSNTANVAVTITGVNDAPVCANVAVTVSEDGPADSTAPDCTDVDVEPLTYTVTQPAQGASSVLAGQLRFDPDGDFEGLDSGEQDTTNGDFTYRADDGDAFSAAANVAVTVNGVNDAPVCLDRTLTTNEDTLGSVAASCTDVDVEPLTITVTQPTKGIASYLNPDLRFDPNGQYEGLDSGEQDTTNGDFTYTANDGTVNSNVANVAVTVTGVNDAPVCADVSITTDEDTLGSTAPDCTDVDVEPLTYTVGAAGEGVSGTSAGDLSYDPDGQFESLDTGESDSDSFTYQASDGTTSSNTANVAVTITGVNDAPVCANVAVTVSEDGPADSTAPDCTDVDVEPLTYTVTQPAQGASSVLAGQLRFDPDGDFEGLDSGEQDTTNGDFTYRADDGDAFSAAANVAVTVNGVNDAPVCLDRTLTTNEDTLGSVAASCTDVDVEPLTITVTQPTKGIASYLNPDLRFDPNGQYEGLDTGEQDTTNGDFTYTANDGTVDSNVADVAVTVNGVNDAPVCARPRPHHERGHARDRSPPTAPTWTIGRLADLTVTQPAKGVASENDGSHASTRTAQFEGLDTGEQDTTNGDFTYTRRRRGRRLRGGERRVTVNGVNDAPVCLDRTLTTNEDTLGSVAATAPTSTSSRSRSASRSPRRASRATTTRISASTRTGSTKR